MFASANRLDTVVPGLFEYALSFKVILIVSLLASVASRMKETLVG